MLRVRVQSPLPLALAFAAASVLWIVVSDHLVENYAGPGTAHLQTAKGLFFVLGAATVLYFVMRRNARLVERSVETTHRAALQIESVFEASADALVIADREGKIFGWNAAAERMFGWRFAEVSGRRVSEVLVPEGLRESHESGLARAARGEGGALLGKPLATYAVRRDGSQFPVELTIIAAGENDALIFSAVIRDMTEAIANSKRLRDSEALWRSVLDQNLVGIYLLQESKFTYANARAQEILGYTLTELQQLESALEVVVETDRERARTELSRRNETDASSQYTLRIRRGDGRIAAVEVYGSRVLTANGVVLTGTLLDVTEKLALEDELRRSEEWFRSLVENASDMIGVIDQAGLYTYLSPSVVPLLGYEPAELLGHSPLEFIHPGDVAEVRTVMQALLEGSVEQVTLELRFQHLRGEWRIIDVVAHTACREGQRIIIVNSRDVTAARELQKQVERSQQLAALGRVAASMAHEFNNVLMAMQTFTEVLDHRSTTDLQREAVEHIRDGIARGKAVTAQVLRLSREVVLDLKPVKAAALLRMLAPEIRGLLPTNIDVRTELEDDVTLLADLSQLQQVVVNLALNARDAMPAGGSLVLSCRRLPAGSLASQRVADPAAYAQLSVIDTGSGMPPEVLEQIFEPLFTTRRGRGGTGLGLTVSHQIIAAHRGEIVVESEPGKGTTFHVLLPMTAEEASPRQRRDALDPAVRHVFIIDDEPAVNEGLQMLLTVLGVATTSALSGAEVLELLPGLEQPPDVILLDYRLRDMTGTDVLQILRSRGVTAPVILMSGHADERVIGELGEETTILQKPFNLETLVKALNKTVKPSD
ncbi:MAG TPA: PAS domain S-box protein [Thermoanaerobaculia bacterium]